MALAPPLRGGSPLGQGGCVTLGHQAAWAGSTYSGPSVSLSLSLSLQASKANPRANTPFYKPRVNQNLLKKSYI